MASADLAGLLCPVALYVHLRADRNGYHPSQRLREQTVLITDTCRFPFCQRPARDCDHEHPVPWPRGPTDSTNAGTACRGHHRVKTHGNSHLHQPCVGVYI